MIRTKHHTRESFSAGYTYAAHVNYTTSSEIDDANSTERIAIKGAQESRRAPDTASNHGVDESGKKERVTQVGHHLTPFRHSAGNNRCRCGSKRPLKEEKDVVFSRLCIPNEKVRVTESTSQLQVTRTCECIADGPET